MVAHPDFVKHYIFWSSILGATVTFGSAAWGIFNWFKKISETNKNIKLVMSNHLPHIGECLQAQTIALQGLKSDIRDLDTKVAGVSQRVGDISEDFHSLEAAFITHLEGTKKGKKGKK